MSDTPDPRDDDEAILDALAAPIPPELLRSRPGQGGQDYVYITAETIRARLNRVLGRANWGLDYSVHQNCVRCVLSVALPSGRVVRRAGIGGYPEANQGANGRGLSEKDRPKGASSDAMKRAALEFGIGLERDEARAIASGRHDYAPGRERRDHQPRQPQAPRDGSSAPRDGHQQEPAGADYTEFRGRDGRALFAWARENELIDVVNRIRDLHGYPFRMTEFSPEQVAHVVAELTGQSAC